METANADTCLHEGTQQVPRGQSSRIQSAATRQRRKAFKRAIPRRHSPTRAADLDAIDKEIVANDGETGWDKVLKRPFRGTPESTARPREAHGPCNHLRPRDAKDRYTWRGQ
jgi:hypothetical protein